MIDLLIKCNVGPRERLARMAVGTAASLGAARLMEPRFKKALRLIGAYGVFTATTRYCPIFHILGISNSQPAYRSFRQILRRL